VTPALLALAAALGIGTAHARSTVVVLTSEELPRYKAAATAFAAQLGQPVEVIRLGGDRARAMRVAADLTADPPPLIFALGEKAAWTAVHHGPTVPIVHAMVDDPARYEIDGAFVTGVRADAPPDAVLAELRLYAPDVQRIGIIIAAGNTSPRVGAAIAAAKEAGFEVTARRVGTSRDVKRAYGNIRNDIDALWVLPDQEVIDPTSFHYLRREAVRARMPMLAWSPALVQAGALMAVTADSDRVAGQAASLAQRVLAGETAGAIPLVDPAATRVVLNRDTLDALGLEVDDGLLDFVDEVVRQPSAR
jgi:putative ABC transport system substrate-binding protein